MNKSMRNKLIFPSNKGQKIKKETSEGRYAHISITPALFQTQPKPLSKSPRVPKISSLNRDYFAEVLYAKITVPWGREKEILPFSFLHPTMMMLKIKSHCRKWMSVSRNQLPLRKTLKGLRGSQSRGGIHRHFRAPASLISMRYVLQVNYLLNELILGTFVEIVVSQWRADG